MPGTTLTVAGTLAAPGELILPPGSVLELVKLADRNLLLLLILQPLR